MTPSQKQYIDQDQCLRNTGLDSRCSSPVPAWRVRGILICLLAFGLIVCDRIGFSAIAKLCGLSRARARVDHRHRLLLHAHRERPCSYRAADQRDEIAPSHVLLSAGVSKDYSALKNAALGGTANSGGQCRLGVCWSNAPRAITLLRVPVMLTHNGAVRRGLF